MLGTRNARRRARALAPMAGLLGALAGASACDDTNDVTIPIINAAVAVFHDTAFDFTTLRTFAMPDTVVHIAPITVTPLAVSRQFDQVALDQVRADLLTRGYTEITNPETVQPDFVVLVGASASAGFDAFVGYDWFRFWGFYSGWGWFTPGFDVTWGIVYPWFPTVGVTSFDRGTLIVDLIPTASANAGTKLIRSAWVGVANGILNGNVTSTTIVAAIDRMFQLSPFLTAPNP